MTTTSATGEVGQRKKSVLDFDGLLERVEKYLEAQKSKQGNLSEEEQREKLKRASLLLASVVPMAMLSGLLTRYFYRNVIQQLFPEAPDFSRSEIGALSTAVGFCAAMPQSRDFNERSVQSIIGERLAYYGAVWALGAYYARRLRKR